jgi:hypothetical protein
MTAGTNLSKRRRNMPGGLIGWYDYRGAIFCVYVARIQRKCTDYNFIRTFAIEQVVDYTMVWNQASMFVVPIGQTPRGLRLQYQLLAWTIKMFPLEAIEVKQTDLGVGYH